MSSGTRLAWSSIATAAIVTSVALAGGEPISVTGTYLQGFECGVIDVDDGGSFQLSGEYPDGIQTGDRIHVDGELDADCFADVPPGLPLCTLPCIVNATITVTPVELCGQIQPGPQSCLTINDEAGGEAYMLGDGLQGAFMFDFVRVAGVLRADAQDCFPIVGTVLDIVDIQPCVPGDVTRDGVVGVGDLVAVILAWGTDDHWADVNGSNVVDVTDLVMVITGWGQTL